MAQIVDNLVEWIWGDALTREAKTEVEKSDRSAIRQLAARYGRGSVRLQQGAFLTKADMEEERRVNARFFGIR